MRVLLISMFLFLVPLFGMAGNFSGSGGKSIIMYPEMFQLASGTSVLYQASLNTSNSEKPYIEKTQWGDILRYPAGDGTLEAWEIIEDFVDPILSGSVFLNYSRFPFGSIEYDGAPTYVCYHYFGDNIYLGTSESQTRLNQAIYFLALERDQLKDARFGNCFKTDEFLAQFPNANSVAEIMKELNANLLSDSI